MVRYCCINTCKELWRPDVDTSFFSFPHDENLLNKWLHVVANKRITKYSSICSKHFKKSDYEEVGNKRKLKRNAVPSLFLSDLAENVTTKTIPSSGSSTSVLNDIINFVNVEENRTICSKEAFIPSDQEIREIPETKDKATQISPRKLKPSERENELKSENKYLKTKIRRLEIKLSNMNDMLRELKKEGKLPDDLEDVLLKSFSGLNLEILKNELENCDKNRNIILIKLKNLCQHYILFTKGVQFFAFLFKSVS